MSNNIKTILVVEDEKALATALKDKLSLEDYKVLTAQNGEQGLKIALRTRPNLILLDIVMPKMDGIEMLKKLRDDQWGKTAKVIILTNYYDNDKLVTALKENIPDYLIKSDWQIEDIVAEVKKKLES